MREKFYTLRHAPVNILQQQSCTFMVQSARNKGKVKSEWEKWGLKNNTKGLSEGENVIVQKTFLFFFILYCGKCRDMHTRTCSGFYLDSLARESYLVSFCCWLLLGTLERTIFNIKQTIYGLATHTKERERHKDEITGSNGEDRQYCCEN